MQAAAPFPCPLWQRSRCFSACCYSTWFTHNSLRSSNVGQSINRNKCRDSIAFGRTFTCCSSLSSKEEHKLEPAEEEVDFVSRMDFAAGSPEANRQHPWDPHKPSYTPLLPKSIRPYPSFEGWFLRLVDFVNGVSVGVIMATNYATAESQVTFLFSFSTDVGADAGITQGCTYSVYARSKESNLLCLPPAKLEDSTSSNEPKGFEWELPNVGRIVSHPNETYVDVTLAGYNFKSHMFNEVFWDACDTERGPEGWARYISILPTHWYVYSLGSQATYELSNDEKGLRIEGRGLAHQEKNWGETFPAGHVWMQAFSPDNQSQLVLSGAFFKVGGSVDTPYIFAMGFRSPDLNINMRTNDPGVLFKDFEVVPSARSFAVRAIGPSHTLQFLEH
ncbi:hypothetical protein KP509_38G045500 [Ceratopteris richardii]|uniref:Uncharacterized protein n=1 Tax=Ceratopteris richardii TaxID=49495 RepID=A0A8T2Q4I7_CERRI|nr:hypothetical protein KP509_38G045500 [Ceratopteris richardii]